MCKRWMVGSCPPAPLCLSGLQEEGRTRELTRSSFFCIQLYFLLEFSSRGSRKFLSGSEKGLSSTSFSMWLLAASRLSREGLTTRFGSGSGEGRETSESVLEPGPLARWLHPCSQPSKRPDQTPRYYSFALALDHTASQH